MDTLLSRSDDELENISPEDELVHFDRIRSNRCPTSDLRVSYRLGADVVTSSYDWVGLYRLGWKNVNTYVTYQWAPVQNVSNANSRTRRRLVVMPRLSYWQSFQSDEQFQVLYIASSGHVIGLSKSFEFGKPEEPDLSPSIFEEWTEEEDSFGSNVMDLLTMDVIALSSGSESSNSSICEVEAEEEEEEDPTVNNVVLWDTKTLAVDFSGKSWLEELALLNNDTIVQEYQQHLVTSPTSSPPSPSPSFPSFSPSSPSTILPASRSDCRPITVIDDGHDYSMFADVEIEVEALPLLFGKKDRKVKALSALAAAPAAAASAAPPAPPALPAARPTSLAVVPAYTSVVTSIKKRLRHAKKPAEQQVRKSRNPIPLAFEKRVKRKSSGADSSYGPLALLPVDYSSRPKRVHLYDVNKDKKCVAIYNSAEKKKAKQDRIKIRIDVIRQLIRTIPESPHLQRPLSCAPDCIGCVASQQLLKLFERRFQISQKNTELLRTNTVSQQETPGPSVASQTSEDMASHMSAMLSFVKKTEETIALLHNALSTTLGKSFVQQDTQTVAETKAMQDATTECNPDEPDELSNEDPDGWKVKESRRIRRLRWLVTRKTEELQYMHDRDQCQRVQLVMYHDIINDLKRNVREERKQAQSARQEAVMLKYQVRRLSAKRTGPAWGKADDTAAAADEAATTVACAPVARLGEVYKSYRDCTAGLATPFYPNKKAFRQDLNRQIKEGHCRFCGMPISAKVDKRVVEEHITYHLQFHV